MLVKVIYGGEGNVQDVQWERDFNISREEILSRVWRLEPRGVTTRTIDVHVARLRQKLRDNPSRPRILITVHGRGYKFTGPEALP